DMIFRLGGDEFIVIARMKSGNSIEKVIKRIRDNFKEPFTLVDIKLNLSLAIGYQEFNPSMDDIESIIAISDKKMYEDKRRQINQ
ncbi:MAG: diguanylate cyclase, partial [Erysipelotrichaceae bacterium]|nr:diguanylate cyclase [Erysipelotrichaceae bacterium]